MDKVPKIGYVFNPKSGRQIQIGGETYKKLIKEGIIKMPEEVKLKDIPIKNQLKLLKKDM